MPIYNLTGKGLTPAKRYPVEAGKTYYFGSVVPSDVVLVTRLDTTYAYYLVLASSAPYRDVDSYIEHIDTREMFEISVYSAMENMQKERESVANTSFYDPTERLAHMDKILIDHDGSDYSYPSDYMTYEENSRFLQEQESKKKPVTRIEPTEVAKLVRAELKTHFPGIKFSVRTRNYSLDVGWTDGPTTKEVESKVGQYHGCTFDGMTDSTNYHDTELEDGSVVHYANHYISFNRDYSVEFAQKVAIEVCKKWGFPEDTIKVYKNNWGSTDWNQVYEKVCKNAYETLNDAFYQALAETTAYNASEETPVEPLEQPTDYSTGVVVGEYKGKPTISLPMGNGYEFSFGVNKAKAILEYIEDIKKFIEENNQ